MRAGTRVGVVEAVPVTDAYGATRLTYPGPAVQVPGNVQPMSNTEDVSGRVIDGLKLRTRSPIPLTARVLVGDVAYEVRGTAQWPNHYEVDLQRVEG